jgi:predicted HAD superfamily Cof-like phosphohydrolase
MSGPITSYDHKDGGVPLDVQHMARHEHEAEIVRLRARVAELERDAAAYQKAAITLDEAYGELSRSMRKLCTDSSAMFDNLTATQARCTDLVNERRGNMTQLATDVREFHRHVGQFIREVGPWDGESEFRIQTDGMMRMRLRLIAEEFFEILEASVEVMQVRAHDAEYAEAREAVFALINECRLRIDLPELVDGLGDLDYVVEGFRQTLGVNGLPVHNEIHRANMTKKRDNLRADGKIIKGPDFVPPDIAGVLVKQGWQR